MPDVVPERRRPEPDVIVNRLTELPSRIDPERVTQQFADNDRIRIAGTRNLIVAAQICLAVDNDMSF
jgi:hypothetical protein